MFFSVPKSYLLNSFVSKLIKGEKELLNNVTQKCFLILINCLRVVSYKVVPALHLFFKV